MKIHLVVSAASRMSEPVLGDLSRLADYGKRPIKGVKERCFIFIVHLE